MKTKQNKTNKVKHLVNKVPLHLNWPKQLRHFSNLKVSGAKKATK